MAGLKELKNRINSVKATQKITKAMKMVAASKLRHTQMAAEAARPYAERMERMIASLGAGVAGRDDAPRLLSGTGADQVHLIVIGTSERGLCGSFNSSIVRAVARQVEALRADGKTVKLLYVGRKGREVLRRRFSQYEVDFFSLQGVRRIGFNNAVPIAQKILELFEAGEFDVCTIYYNRFVSVLTQTVTAQQLIPAPLPEVDEGAAPDLQGAVYEYEPDEEEILSELLPRNLAVQVFRALLENAASEQGARMAAMDSATRNAGDMIDRLTLQYNRERQAAITKELIEIISGAEAL